MLALGKNIHRGRWSKPHSLFATVAVLVILAVAAAAPAAAAVCMSSSASATSQAAYFQFAGASRARTAWRRKVVRDPKLGKPFSRWSRARDSRITCRQIAQRYRCVAVAQPCKSGSASAKRGTV